MGIGKRIKQAREELKLTQSDLANIVGVTKAAIGNYESEYSHPKENILYELMKALGVDANFLFQDEMEETPKDEMMELRQQFRERPEMKMLFDLTKKSTKEDVEFVSQMLERMKKDSNHE